VQRTSQKQQAGLDPRVAQFLFHRRTEWLIEVDPVQLEPDVLSERDPRDGGGGQVTAFRV
jgi:hypothetical protein